MELRYYQREAVAAVYDHLRKRTDNPCVVLPTGAGKTPVIATICSDAVTRWSGRVVVLAHVKELLQQTVDKLGIICPDVSAGVYSAGLGSRDTKQSVIVAGIQSVYKRATDLGRFDLALVDECHLIPTDGDGMYRQFLAEAKVVNPKLRVIGLTATPYRLDSGLICGPDNILNHVCYEIGVRELIAGGYLSQIVSKGSRTHADLSQVHIRGGEFIPAELEQAMSEDHVITGAIAETLRLTEDRHSVLVFASGVKHGEKMAHGLADAVGEDQVATVFGDTPSAERSAVIERFKAGSLKYVVNMGVFTTGFDAPNVDAVVLARATLSPGLYYQMVGRGFRVCDGKRDCVVLDFGENVLRHGPVDRIRALPSGNGDGETAEPPMKTCPSCQSIVLAAYLTCPDCGFTFPTNPRHQEYAGTQPVISTQATMSTSIEPVESVIYEAHTKRDAPIGHPQTLKVTYYYGMLGSQMISEWVCIAHQGFARRKAEEWWRRRSKTICPVTIKEAIALADDGFLATPKTITLGHTSDSKYPQIVDMELGEIPEYREPGWDEEAEAEAEQFRRDHNICTDLPF